MIRIQSLWLVVSLVLLPSVLSKQICDFKDVKCLTRGAKNVYKSIVAGTITNSIDPLHADKITGELATLKYEMANSTLSGLKNCEVLLLKVHFLNRKTEHLYDYFVVSVADVCCLQPIGTFRRCDSEKLTYEYHLQCPELIFDCYFEIKGDLGTTSIDGRGLSSITIDDYLLILKGSYSKFISEKDQKLRLTININSLNTDLKGRLTIKSKYLISGDKAKSDFVNAHFNDNYKATEKIFRFKVLEKYLAIFGKEVDTYLKTIPLEEVIPRD